MLSCDIIQNVKSGREDDSSARVFFDLIYFWRLCGIPGPDGLQTPSIWGGIIAVACQKQMLRIRAVPKSCLRQPATFQMLEILGERTHTSTAELV